ncbi:MAG: redoxin domain-containing protein [Lentimicrobiaceae bacterium]|nr:redoxin domain-containing protein [Lentimicrobiaceae bacterium]
MRKGIFLLYVIGTQCFASYALKPVVIEGTAAFAKEGKVRFYLYNDLLLQQREMFVAANVNKDGSFRAEIPIEETCLLSFAYNTNYGSIYIEPEKKYTVELFADEQTLPYIFAEMVGEGLKIRILPIDTTELNYKINRFDYYYNYFWQFFGENLMSQTPEKYDSLKQLLVNRFPYNPDAVDYYSVYVKYKIASIDLLYYHKEKEKLYDKYLNIKYIFYQNTAYMDFFDHFFEDYLYAGSRKVAKPALYQNINEKCDYYKLLDDLGKDPLLRNEVIREMVLVKALGELYGMDKEFSQRNILMLLRQMTQVSKFQDHRTMAENMIHYLLDMKPGTAAPDFSLKDVRNTTVKLSDFKGKYVYLHFFSTYCDDCIREMLSLKWIKETYKDNVQIISIMLDFEQTKLYHFVNDYKEFDWLFLHFGSDYDFLDAYKPYNLPYAVLINPEGLVVSNPAKSPMEEGFGMLFFSLFPQAEPQKLPQNRR